MHYTRLDVVANHPSGSVVPAKGTHPQRYTTRTVFHDGPFLGVNRMNLIELILKQLLSGDMLGNLAGELGASTEDAKKAISASVPAQRRDLSSCVHAPTVTRRSPVAGRLRIQVECGIDSLTR